jgi:uncharacterized YccA/Bax inhibitor family protein
MSLFKSGNPTLSEKKFRSTQIPTDIVDQNAMTRQGTMQKFGFMLLLLIGTSLYSWKEFSDTAGTSSHLMPMILIGAIGGLIIALVLMFKQTWAPFLAPLYALLEGLFIGAISASYDYMFPGLVANAVGLTFGVGIAMYLLYQFNIIKATEKFKSIVFTATAGLAIFYLVVWVLNMFGVNQLHFIHEGGTFGILFSVFVVALASLNLILDFDMIDQGVDMGAPKYMEWYGAFGLMVTFVWLYLEILRLLAKLNSRD